MTSATQLTLFDYEQLDTETRIVVQQRTGEIKGVMKRTAQDIIEIGEKLIEVKDRLPHGSFGGWLEIEFKWSVRTAQKYMSIADAFSNTKSSSDLSMSFETMAYLAAPSTPDDVRQQAIERAEAGDRITHSEAKQMVKGGKAAEAPQMTFEQSVPALSPTPEADPEPEPIAGQPAVRARPCRRATCRSLNRPLASTSRRRPRLRSNRCPISRSPSGSSANARRLTLTHSSCRSASRGGALKGVMPVLYQGDYDELGATVTQAIREFYQRLEKGIIDE